MFLFKLAITLKKTVSEIEATMTSAELSEWLAYAGLETLPDLRLSLGIVAHTMAASNWPGKGPRPKLEDYMPRARFDLEPLDADDAAERLIRQFGAVRKG